MTRLRMTRGDSAVFEVAVAIPATAYDQVPTPVDITGATIWFTAKRRLADADGSAVIAKVTPSGVVITSAAGGLAEVRLAAADTASLEAPTTLHYDVQVRDATGQTRTVDAGLLVIQADVTRAT